MNALPASPFWRSLLVAFGPLVVLCSLETKISAYTLTLAWDRNPQTDADIFRYTVYYGDATNAYTGLLLIQNFPRTATEVRGTVTNLEPGRTYFFAVSAWNTNGQSDLSAPISYAAPTITLAASGLASPAEFPTDEDTPITIPLLVQDNDTAPLLLRVDGKSDNQGLIPDSNVCFEGYGSNRTVTIWPSLNQVGSGRLTLSVSDGIVSANTSLLLTVNPVNDPPTLDLIEDVALISGQASVAAALSGITSGATNEVQNLTVSAHSSNTLLVPIPTVGYSSPGTQGVISLQPAPNVSGTATITVTVTDGGAVNNIFTRRFTAYVRAATNSPPVLSPIGAQQTDEDTPPPSVAFTVTDANTPAASLNLKALSSNTNVLPPGNIVFGGSGANRTIALSPAPNQFGSSVVTVVAIDPNGGMAKTSFSFSVRAANDLPTVSSIPNQTLVEDTDSNLIVFSVADVESKADALIVSALSSDPALLPGQNIFLGGNGVERAITVRPLPDAFGTASVSVVVADLEGGRTTNSFNVEIVPVNDPPTLDPLRDLTVSGIGGEQHFALTGIGAGAANEGQTASITATSSNPGLVPDPAVVYDGSSDVGGLIVAPLQNEDGSAEITVSINDGGQTNNLLSRTFTVFVLRQNRLPQVSPLLDQTVNEDTSTGEIPFTVSDVETPPDRLAVGAFSFDPVLAGGGSFVFQGQGANRTLVVTPAPDQFGTSFIVVEVWDEEFGRSVSGFFLVVLPVNDQPTLDPIEDRVLARGADAQTIVLRGISSGALNEYQNLTIGATSSNAVLLPNPSISYTSPDSTGMLTLLPSSQATGSVTITVTVRDDGGTANGGRDTFSRSFVVQIVELPKLHIESFTTNVVLSWPAAATEFQLEGAEQCVSTAFQTMTVLPIVVEGRNTVMLPTTNACKYFRLLRPQPLPRSP